MAAAVDDLPVEFASGERYDYYSNRIYFLLALLIERLSGVL
jgi:hypothetical protein